MRREVWYVRNGAGRGKMRVLYSLGGVMSRPKIVFFDIDDTLYHKDAGLVPQSAQEALAALHAEGILTAIATAV